METTTVLLGIALPAPPQEVVRALTDSVEHSRFTEAESVLDAEEGGAFSYFGGVISGTFREVSPTRIVQELRAADWPEGHTATVDQTFEPQADGERTFVRVREDGVPSDHLGDVVSGWSAYWEKLAAYLRERRVDVVRRFIDQYKNHQDWDAVDKMIASHGIQDKLV